MIGSNLCKTADSSLLLTLLQRFFVSTSLAFKYSTARYTMKSRYGYFSAVLFSIASASNSKSLKELDWLDQVKCHAIHISDIPGTPEFTEWLGETKNVDPFLDQLIGQSLRKKILDMNSDLSRMKSSKVPALNSKSNKPTGSAEKTLTLPKKEKPGEIDCLHSIVHRNFYDFGTGIKLIEKYGRIRETDFRGNKCLELSNFVIDRNSSPKGTTKLAFSVMLGPHKCHEKPVEPMMGALSADLLLYFEKGLLVSFLVKSDWTLSLTDLFISKRRDFKS
ncbi:MAG: hypothetical protein NT027_01395 [Proteobacteria bacterium]|nr:hypothetical protein [Pseudomonadota bacterium]